MSERNPAEQFIAKATASLAEGTFVRLALTSPVAGNDGPKKILARLIRLKGTPHLSLTLRHPTRDMTQNLAIGEVATWLRSQVGGAFRSALLGTTSRDWQFISNESGAARLVDHKPATKLAPSREHDREHAGILDAGARDWLAGLGILDASGKVRASMADKHRQINRYLEILSHLAKDCGWTGAAESGPARKPALRFADMGCGKGYLTFGLWHLFQRTWNQPVNVIGIETRADLVTATNKLARQIGAEGLEFRAGEIASANIERVDGLIALHACNTATDDAICRGIELGAKLIVVAPCCHKELRAQLGRPGALAPVLSHGVMEERMAEWVTDGLRSLFLEWAGYRTKLMEFVSSEHTPKNLMLAAVREREAFMDDEARERIVTLKTFFNIERHALDALLTR